ncbi:MAG: nitroreductase [Deltaproteobacteria bacterium]|nr:nitroreductase [Deltaproteobacteria bacterium]
MDIIEAIVNRSSIRGFKSDPIPRNVLEELLQTCLWAPSTWNMQPWEFAVLGGEVMEEVKARLEKKTRMGADIDPDIPEPELFNPYLQRQIDLMTSIDTHQFPPGTSMVDKKRAEYLLKGSRFYDAPNAIIIYTEKALCPSAIFDAGIITQTIALAALAYGLGTCIMARVLFWPDILKKLLRIPESKLIVIGIAIGYPDPQALVNSVSRAREPLDTFARWHGI